MKILVDIDIKASEPTVEYIKLKYHRALMSEEFKYSLQDEFRKIRLAQKYKRDRSYCRDAARLVIKMLKEYKAHLREHEAK